MMLDLTERERAVIGFALNRFAATARDRFDVCNQKMRNGMKSPFDAIEAAQFLKDARDADALIDRLRAQQEGK